MINKNAPKYYGMSAKQYYGEAKDDREYGYEGEMAMSQIKAIMNHSKQLLDLLEPDTDLPEWVQSKITLAADYIQTAADYMASEMTEATDEDKRDFMAKRARIATIKLPTEMPGLSADPSVKLPNPSHMPAGNIPASERFGTRAFKKLQSEEMEDKSVVGPGTIMYTDPKTGKKRDYISPVTLNNPHMQASKKSEFKMPKKIPLPPTRGMDTSTMATDSDIEKIKKDLAKEEVQVNEGRMPASVIRHKTQLADMSDAEFAEKHGNKTEKELRDMAARHGYGWNKATKTGSDHYVKRVARGMKREEAEQIDEVLTKKTPIGTWIRDFVHSDNPKFAGKSKKERMKQAIAAYYAKQRNEEVSKDEAPFKADADDKREAPKTPKAGRNFARHLAQKAKKKVMAKEEHVHEAEEVVPPKGKKLITEKAKCGKCGGSKFKQKGKQMMCESCDTPMNYTRGGPTETLPAYNLDISRV